MYVSEALSNRATSGPQVLPLLCDAEQLDPSSLSKDTDATDAEGTPRRIERCRVELLQQGHEK